MDISKIEKHFCKVLGTSNSGVALRILGVALTVGEKGVALIVGETAASHLTPLLHAPDNN